MQLNATEIFVYGTVWTAVWGLIVWFAKDRVSSKRDRKARKHHFLDYMADWRGEVETEFAVHLLGLYVGRVPRLRAEAGKIRDDFSKVNRTEFDKLVTALASIPSQDIVKGKGDKPGRHVIRDAIDALVTFVEAEA